MTFAEERISVETVKTAINQYLTSQGFQPVAILTPLTPVVVRLAAYENGQPRVGQSREKCNYCHSWVCGHDAKTRKEGRET